MSTKLPGTNIHSIHFSGTCKHCGNATLLHIIELNIHSCAFCHQSEPDIATTFSHQKSSHENVLISKAS